MPTRHVNDNLLAEARVKETTVIDAHLISNTPAEFRSRQINDAVSIRYAVLPLVIALHAELLLM